MVYATVLAALLTVYVLNSTIIFLLGVWGRSLRKANRPRRRSLLKSLGIDDENEKYRLLGFFHPFSNAGGGGERVLWTAIAYHQRLGDNLICVVYTGDIDVTKDQIITQVKSRFHIILDPSTLALVVLRKRHLVEDSTWPRFTLLGQSLGSIVLGYEAMKLLIPDIFIDTMGYAFVLPMFRHLAMIPVGAYVHYPTISAEMISRVRQRRGGVTNQNWITSSRWATNLKLLYYNAFANLYASCLDAADVIMVNSSWTKNHIDHLLSGHSGTASTTSTIFSRLIRMKSSVHQSGEHFSSSAELESNSTPDQPTKASATIVYPPCDTTSFARFDLKSRKKRILSISQFRPEKAQHVQISAVATLLKRRPNLVTDYPDFKLILAGSVRNEEDRGRVEALQQLAESLGVRHLVDFEVNVGWNDLVDLLASSLIGISTMVDEHFGISVVEFMAAGLAPLVHSSGGPLQDIVVPFNGSPTGFHASTDGDYADRIEQALDMPDLELEELRARARATAEMRFSVANFEGGWARGAETLRALEESRARQRSQS